MQTACQHWTLKESYLNKECYHNIANISCTGNTEYCREFEVTYPCTREEPSCKRVNLSKKEMFEYGMNNSAYDLEQSCHTCNIEGGTRQSDGTCLCDTKYCGDNCDKHCGDSAEDKSYALFYAVTWTSLFILGVITCCVTYHVKHCSYESDNDQHEDGCSSKCCGVCTWERCCAPPTVILRTFDAMTDWAFFAINLAPGSEFDTVYTRKDKNFAAVRWTCLFFCIVGSIMWVADMICQWGGLFFRKEDSKISPAYMAGFVIAASALLEDIPQLAIQSVYFHHMGFNEPIALYAFVSSIFSLVLSIIMAIKKGVDL